MGNVTQLPTGTNLSIRQLAEETGFDRDTVSKKLTESGVRPSGKRGGHPVYRLRDALPALYVTGPDGRQDPEKMDPFRRKAHYQAEHELLSLARERGELVPRMEVEQEQARVLKILVQALDTLPDLLERDCALTAAALGRVEQIVDGAREQMYEALAEPDVTDDPGAVRESA
jgi:hypothetical protein